MRCKKLFITAIAGSFFLGVMVSEPIKDLRKNFHHEAAEGFYEQPYNLKIKTKKNLDGKIESYLCDTETKQSQKIGHELYVGDNKHRIKAAGDIIIKIAEKKLKILSELYSLVFDND